MIKGCEDFWGVNVARAAHIQIEGLTKIGATAGTHMYFKTSAIDSRKDIAPTLIRK
jgi:hypothetical protein